MRRARPEDDDFIFGLGSASASSSVSSIRPVPNSVASLSFQRLIAFCRERPGTVELVAELDGARAGFLLMITDVPDDVTGEDQAFVAYMAVDADARRRGVGAALIREADAAANTLGLPCISLMVTSENVGARALYEHAGFREERVVMTKPLAPAGIAS